MVQPSVYENLSPEQKQLVENALAIRLTMMPHLFVEERFQAHSGGFLNEKIECDALRPSDWFCLANMIARRVGPYKAAIGVPRGGIPLQDALNSLERDKAGPVLIVDDVLTTGNSLLSAMSNFGDDCVGYVVFDRSGKPLPDKVRALFTLNDVEA